jgi:hypothetical protein
MRRKTPELIEELELRQHGNANSNEAKGLKTSGELKMAGQMRKTSALKAKSNSRQ